jgi:hypothetical protein
VSSDRSSLELTATASRRGFANAPAAILGLEDAALYQALHRLERRGLIVSEWGLSDAEPKCVVERCSDESTKAKQGRERKFAFGSCAACAARA